MTVQEALDQIKGIAQKFGLAEPAPIPATPEPAALAAEYKTADGKVLSIDKLEAGGAVLVDGQPHPDGEVTLEDGTILSIAGGLIAVVTPVAAPDMNKQFSEQLAALKTEFDTHKTAFNQYQTEFTAAKETISKQDQAIQGLLEVVQTLADTAVAQPSVTPSNFEAQVDFEKMTPLQKFRATK